MQGVDHYENFPVASWLCPARLRPTVTALYHYARTADDIADEGDASPAQRLAELAAYRAELERALAGQPPADPHSHERCQLHVQGAPFRRHYWSQELLLVFP